MTAYVLYENLFNQAGATLVYSHEVDSSGAFSHDNLLYDKWVHGQSIGTPYIEVQLSGASTIDTWAIFGHNLGTNNSQLTLKRYASGAWTTVDSFNPTDDKPVFRSVGASDTRYRIEIANPSADDQIYHVAIGQALQLKPLNTGFKPPMFEQFMATNSVNRHGVLLGRSVAKSARPLNIRQNAITTAELYSNYKGWLDHAVKKPFLFCWNYETYPGDTVFCWLDAAGPEPVYSNLCHLSIDMQVQAMLWHEVPST